MTGATGVTGLQGAGKMDGGNVIQRVIKAFTPQGIQGVTGLTALQGHKESRDR